MCFVTVSWGSWQQCIDENTQHPYYWNTTTNEVTWTVPEEIALQYQRITDETTEKGRDVDEKENKSTHKNENKSTHKDEKENKSTHKPDKASFEEKTKTSTVKGKGTWTDCAFIFVLS